jgi:ABC-type uncharacterized transport system substrate-binding protein
MGSCNPLRKKRRIIMGNVLLIKIKKNGLLKAIDAIDVKEGGLIHHHRLDLDNFSWSMNSADMLDELRDVVFESVQELNNRALEQAKLNVVQFDLFNSIIKRFKKVYQKKGIDKISYLVEKDTILNDGSLPVMEWVTIPKK